MKKSLVSIVKKQFSNRQTLYLKDPNADVYVLLGEKIYPLHIKFLADIDFFAKADIQSSKIVMVDACLDVIDIFTQQISFERVIGYYYGQQLQFSRNWDIIPLMHVLFTLKAQAILKNVMNDIKENVDEYGFFLLVTISQKYNVKWLKQTCQEDLVLMGFQQLNFNRSDLMKVEKSILESLIRQHELYRINQNIIGLKQVHFKKILKEYCTSNGLPDSEYNYFCSQLLYQISQQKEKSGDIIRKPSIKDEPGSDLSASTKLKLKASESKDDELSKLKLINAKIQQKGVKMIQQIKVVQNQLENSSKLENNQQSNDLNENTIEQRFKKWEKVSQEQDTRFLSLKAEIEKLNPQLKKSEQSEQKVMKPGMNGSTNSTKDNDDKSNPRSRRMSQTGTLIPFMPVLSRDLE